jgi:chromosome segregation ATPase
MVRSDRRKAGRVLGARGNDLATESVSAPGTDLARLVGWLEERRVEDHERLMQLARLVQQLQDDARDQEAALARVSSRPPQVIVEPPSDAEAAGPGVEELQEHLAIVARAVEEHITTQARVEQVESSERDRDRRQVVELVQKVDNLSRTLEGVVARTLALVEEIRRERESRLPLTQGLDEVRTAQTGVQSRLSLIDELIRRQAAFQTAVEQSSEKRQADIARLDNQVKLLEVRVVRELADLRRTTEEWQRNAEEHVRTTNNLAKQVVALADQRDGFYQRVAEVHETIDRLVSQLDRLEAQAKADRASFGRLVEANEALGRRIDAAGASAWQIGERSSAMAADMDTIRADVKELGQRLDELIHKVSWSDDDRQRIEAGLATLGNDLRVQDRDWRERTEGLLHRFDAAISTLMSRTETRHQLVVEHLRRTVGELQQQLLELEGGSA